MSAWARKATISSCFCRSESPGLLYTSPYKCSLQHIPFPWRQTSMCWLESLSTARGHQSPDPFAQRWVCAMHLLPDGTCCFAVHKLERVPRGSTNFSRGVCIQHLNSTACCQSADTSGRRFVAALPTFVMERPFQLKPKGGRAWPHLGCVQVVGCSQAGAIACNSAQQKMPFKAQCATSRPKLARPWVTRLCLHYEVPNTASNFLNGAAHVDAFPPQLCNSEQGFQCPRCSVAVTAAVSRY